MASLRTEISTTTRNALRCIGNTVEDAVVGSRRCNSQSELATEPNAKIQRLDEENRTVNSEDTLDIVSFNIFSYKLDYLTT